MASGLGKARPNFKDIHPSTDYIGCIPLCNTKRWGLETLQERVKGLMC